MRRHGREGVSYRLIPAPGRYADGSYLHSGDVVFDSVRNRYMMVTRVFYPDYGESTINTVDSDGTSWSHLIYEAPPHWMKTDRPMTFTAESGLEWDEDAGTLSRVNVRASGMT